MAINYIEKGWGLHQAINGAGFRLKPNTNDEAFDMSGNQSATIDAIVQGIIDSFNPLPVAQRDAIMAISEHAASLIDARVHPIKQKRLKADAIAVLIKKGKGNINAAEQAGLDKYEAAITYPAAIFAQYDIEEAAILSAVDWQAVDVAGAIARLDAIA